MIEVGGRTTVRFGLLAWRRWALFPTWHSILVFRSGPITPFFER